MSNRETDASDAEWLNLDDHILAIYLFISSLESLTKHRGKPDGCRLLFNLLLALVLWVAVVEPE